MGCRCCSSGIVSIPPYYTQAGYETYQPHDPINLGKCYTAGVRIASAWAMPEVASSVKVSLSEVSDIPINAYLYNPTYGYLKIVSWEPAHQIVELYNEGLSGAADAGTAIPECTVFVMTARPCCADAEETVCVSDNTVVTGKIIACDAGVQKILVGTDNDQVLKVTDNITGETAFGQVVTNSIAVNAITSDRIIADAITTVKILNSAVTTAKIADENVTTVKIADGNVTNAKLADLGAKTSFTPTLISNADYDAHTTVTGATGDYWTFGPFIIARVSISVSFDGTAGGLTHALYFTLPVAGRTSDGSNCRWIGSGDCVADGTSGSLMDSYLLVYTNPTQLCLAFGTDIAGTAGKTISIGGFVIYPTR